MTSFISSVITMIGGGASKDDVNNNTDDFRVQPNVILSKNPRKTLKIRIKKKKKKQIEKTQIEKIVEIEESNECNVCDEPYNKSTRSKIHCKSCGDEYCRQCAKQYILGSIKDAHCLSCKHKWDMSDMVEYINASFSNNNYVEHRKKILFQKEQSRFPETMPYVEGLRKKDKYDVLCRQITTLKNQYKRHENEIFSVNVPNEEAIEITINKLHDEQKKRMKKIVLLEYNRKILSAELKNKGLLTEKERKVTFIHACPADNCKGFLSTAWKCGLCDMWTCPTCFELKGLKKNDPDNPHECKEENIKSAEMIKKETKNCPKCAVPIYKINGCFDGDTQILCWDGKNKLAKNIKIGDTLIGLDGEKRTVLRVTTGTDQMYEVQQNKAVNYTVNSKHTLVLQIQSHKSIHKEKRKDYTCYKVMWFNKNTYRFQKKRFRIEKDAHVFRNTIHNG